MKLVFFGDCMFGRNGNYFIEDPFVHVKDIIQSGSHIFFNLETVISNPPLPKEYKVNKVFNYQSTGEQLVSLKKITKKPIFVSVSTNHSLDFGSQGHRNTMKFLKRHLFLTNSKQKVESNGIVFFNATDHCGCDNPELWSQHITMIDYQNTEPILRRVRALRHKFIVFSIHWSKNWIQGDMPQHIQEFGKALIDNGVNIVFGHSAHHIVKNPLEMYNGGVIIYGLGDFINDYSVRHEYQSDEAMICIVHKKGNKLTPELIRVKREFVEQGSSIPIPI